ncbi:MULTISPECIES: ROK family protein [unclassified Mycoplasma]|uniref:ROK family protein n=1 Tax=unclassified Mycoplasma TaxID=2683645 RepID=UPI00211C408D|nr:MULTISPECIES: ROK family protein [unclassified Mycoplasma]UUM19920.1 ROK family protein [Mycoplasma sp. 1578d]UUM24901.1 ROK family protein [Mycoplasma sp. 3686d]
MFEKAVVDIGGTNTRFAIIENNQIIFKDKFATNPENAFETLNRIIALAQKFKIQALALCLPGPADYQNGIILETPNLPNWANLNVKQHMLNNLSLEKIVFQNDANAAGLGAHYRYNKVGTYTQFFTLSTGFGGGLVIDHKIVSGYNFQAQELAKLPLGPQAQPAFHLSPYASEIYLSGSGWALQAQQKGYQTSAKEILQDYHNGLTYAQEIIDNAIFTLTKVIATSVAFINPNLIVFSGPISVNAPFIIEQAFANAKQLMWASQAQVLDYKIDQLGEDLALFGLNELI